MPKKAPTNLKKYEFMIKNERPEEYAQNPETFYTAERVQEYANSKAIMSIQEKITKRALEIAQIEPPALILDLGMGCGFSTAYLFLKKYKTIGVDLNRLFLNYYHTPELNRIQGDITEIWFRPNTIDMILSISAIQWILAEKSIVRRTKTLRQLAIFCAKVLKLKGKLVFQYYPKNNEVMHEVGSAFKSLGGFEGTFIIDNPDNPRKRKIYLYLEKVQELSEHAKN